MKNLMLYINPSKKFDDERGVLAKISIENSLRLGWKPEDIVLVTNFPYEYKGIKAILVEDSVFCEVHDKASKINVFINLIKNGVIGDELVWFHDFDAFQIKKFTEEDVYLDGFDTGFTDYGWKSRWNTGSIFFKKESLKVFEWIRNELYTYNHSDEEQALTKLTDRNYRNINSMYKRLNITFNLPACLNGVRKMKSNYERADKPIRVMHFHPFYKKINFIEINCLDKPAGVPLIPKGLVKIFKKHLPNLCQKI